MLTFATDFLVDLATSRNPQASDVQRCGQERESGYPESLKVPFERCHVTRATIPYLESPEATESLGDLGVRMVIPHVLLNHTLFASLGVAELEGLAVYKPSDCALG
ncbi:hypothetical protein XPA_001608 [Xanthoria parietina]